MIRAGCAWRWTLGVACAAALGAGMAPRAQAEEPSAGGGGLSLWQQASAMPMAGGDQSPSVAAGADAALALRAISSSPALPGLAQAGGPGQASSHPTTRKALVPALMSAVVPGSGQLRNGSVLRGLTFAALEVTGWMAWLSFRHQSDQKREDLEAFAGSYWDYDRYQRVAQDPDSCLAAGCGCENWTLEADSLIAEASQRGGNRFYDYITRDIYACGWDTQLSRSLYLGLWDDREDLLDSKRLTGRLIFLNHLVSAVDAFLQARRVRVAGVAQLGVRLAGVPREPHPQLVFGTRLD